MVNVPLRAIGELGVITDYGDHDLPLKACTDAINMRFDRGYVSRWSVFKTYDAGFTFAIASKHPVGVVEAGGSETTGCLIAIYNDGTMRQRNSGSSSFVTPSGSLGTSDLQATSCRLGGITYVNRDAYIPVYRKNPSDGNFVDLTGWDTNDRCKVLRSYKDYLIALNVTKTATEYRGMVKWSNAAQAGAPPADWDVNDDASHAGENVLSDCDNQLLDGLALGNMFIIYGETQVWRMQFIGQPFIFSTELLFPDQGIMNTNCVVAANNLHYVFGKDEIYAHDGIQKIKIADAKIQKALMSDIKLDQYDRCFVMHDRRNAEVIFAYPSSNSDAQWNTDNGDYGCNRAWVFNYRSNTWYPVDLPNAICWTEASRSDTLDWDDMTTSFWNGAGSTWSSYEGNKPRLPVIIAGGNVGMGGSVAVRPYFIDNLFGGSLNQNSHNPVSWPAWAEWRYKDMDELQIELYGRKQANHVDLQFGAVDSENTITFKMGQSRGANTAITWGNELSINPWVDTRYDTRINDRYLAWRVYYPAGADASFGGFDLDIIKIAGR